MSEILIKVLKELETIEKHVSREDKYRASKQISNLRKVLKREIQNENIRSKTKKNN
jgi:flagellar biosynthesis regulator FlbT